ncbi:MAG: hypothetical protein IPH78_02965 [Bacteroidetes bacterium]|nr:hypothetical protein [Bacteroidota bacterium]
MKKITYTIAFIMCSLAIQKANAQWYETGNTAATGDFIGTLNYKPFPIHTSSNFGGGERMRIDEIGNVGIGTQAPAVLSLPKDDLEL